MNPNSQREALIQALRDLADNAYCDYIRQMQRTECLGWEQKVKEGKFGRAELEAHNRGAAFFGKHQAYIEARQRLEALPPESGGPTDVAHQFVVCWDKGVVQNIQYEGKVYVPEQASSEAGAERGWISVSDRIPVLWGKENWKDKPYVLAVDTKGRMSIGYCWRASQGEICWTFAKAIGDVTHWMPLPPLPVATDSTGGSNG